MRGSAAARLAVSSADMATAADTACVRFEVFTGIKLTEANALWEEFSSYLFGIPVRSAATTPPAPDWFGR